MGKPKEYERTCSRCDTKWYVTAAERKELAPNRMMIAGASMQLIGGQKKAAQMRMHKEIVDNRGRCSSCGSSSYSERPAP